MRLLILPRREGSVVSLAEPREEFVIKKLARRLDLEIPLRELAYGGLRSPTQGQKEASLKQ